MKRKSIPLLLLLCLVGCSIFLACKQKQVLSNNPQTCLIIKNHSSVSIEDITYNGKKLNGIIQAGGIARLLLDDEGEGYVFFSIECRVRDEKDNVERRKKPVKSANFIVVEKMKSISFLL